MRAVGVNHARLWGILVGDGDDWAFGLALVELGLVRVLRSRFGFEFQLTERGLVEAHTLAEARRSGRRL